MPWLKWLGAFSACLALSSPSRQAAPLQAPSPAEPRSGQSPQLILRTQEEKGRGYQTAHHIVLNVRVSDASGRPSTELEETDFTLLEDHQPRKIARFRSIQGGSAISPAHIILVLDTVNNSSGRLGYFGREIERYLRKGDGLLAYPMSIALFSDSGVSVGHPSRDRNALIEELKALTGHLHTIDCADTVDMNKRYLPTRSRLAPTDPNPQLDCMNHQFNASVTALTSLAEQQASVPVRVILVWIGQGWPSLTDNGFIPDTASIKRSFFHNLVEISSAMTEAQVTLDAIASPDLSPGPGARNSNDSAFFNGVRNESQATPGSLGLHALAHESGGQILKNTKDIAGEINACIADAESYYVLSFDSSPAAGFGEYHSLEVKVDKPELTVRTNTLYYAEQ